MNHWANSIVSLGEMDSGDEVGTLTLRVERDLSYESAHEVLAAVRDLVGRSPGEIVIELGGAQMIDSSGLRVLLVSRLTCEEAGIGFRLTRLTQCVERIIRLSGLAELFDLPGIAEATLPRKQGVRLGPLAWKSSEHVVASNPELISVLREKVTAAAESAGADGDTLCDIKIAVGEALTNAYRHGSPDKGVSKIEVRYRTCSAAVVVEVQDEGAPFDPDSTPEPDPRKLKDHGMGIYLMRQAMDQVDFGTNSTGNWVRMVKWLSCKDVPSSV